MGLTLIRKTQSARPKRNPRIALVLAGGAVSGGAFKVGGLKALDDFLVGRRMTDLDLYVGLSAGALLAVPLAYGFGPDEMVKVLEGNSSYFAQIRPVDFYRPNWSEFARRPAQFLYQLYTYLPRVGLDLVRALPTLPDSVGSSFRAFARERSYARFEKLALELLAHVSPKREIPSFSNHIPSGFFDNSSLERWMRGNLERIGLPNDFQEHERRSGRKLYISACNLDTAQRVIFGPDEHYNATISQAVQASSALPVFYKPARINGTDYVDGGVRNTANIDIAIEKGADLVICYNPFAPFVNRRDVPGAEEFFPERHLADRGLKFVANQSFRTLLHSRLRIALKQYLEDDRFQGDIVLLEPREMDSRFFAMNPLAFWKRSEALEHGFESVRRTIEQNFEPLSMVLGRYGLQMNRRDASRRAAAARRDLGWTHHRNAGVKKRPTQLRLLGSQRGSQRR
ncbi:MAG: patatin-like phospholipase family protein [Deltaproteobacteria bacterium]|nr:MAG: patatin-like phospholipase family protein [Deltaproteobacteria bacterium]